MLWLSAGKSIDGVWVGSYFQENANTTLPRVEAALRLIAACDRPRYNRLIRDLDRVWVRLLTTGVAGFHPAMRACLIDERFVLAQTTDTTILASAIVHEATHARLWHRGFGYDEARRHRVEAICLRRELAFARRLPDGGRVREWAEAALGMSASSWSDAALQARGQDGRIQVLQHLDRNWLARLALAIYSWRKRRAQHQ